MKINFVAEGRIISSLLHDRFLNFDLMQEHESTVKTEKKDARIYLSATWR